MVEQPDGGSAVRAELARLGADRVPCLIYESREEQSDVAAVFLLMGIERGEQCFYLAGDRPSAKVVEGLHRAGIDVDRAVASRQLIVRPGRGANPEQGRAEPRGMVDLVRAVSELTKSSPFPAARVAVEATSLIHGCKPRRFAKTMSQVHGLLSECNGTSLCQYDWHRCSQGDLKAALAAHPTVLHGGRACKSFDSVLIDSLLGPKQMQSELRRLLAGMLLPGRGGGPPMIEMSRCRQVSRNTQELTALLEVKWPTYVYVSPAALAVLGYAQEGLLERGWAEFVHPEDRARVRKAFLRSAAGGGSARLRFRTNGGAYVLLNAAGQAVRDENGRDLALIVARSRGSAFPAESTATNAPAAGRAASSEPADGRQQEASQLAQLSRSVQDDLRESVRAVASCMDQVVSPSKDRPGSDQHGQADIVLARMKRVNNLLEGLLNYLRMSRQRTCPGAGEPRDSTFTPGGCAEVEHMPEGHGDAQTT